MAKILPAGQHYGTFLTKWSSGTQMVCRIEYQAGSKFKEHGNERASVVFIERGYQTKSFGRSELQLFRGSMLLIPPSYLQVDRFESNTTVLAAEIPGSLLAELRTYGIVLHQHIQIAECDAIPFRNRLRRELVQADDLSGLIFESIFAELFVNAVRRTRQEQRPPVPRMLRVRDLLHDCMSETPKLREIAAAIDVHPSQLSRDFRRCFGISPGEYLRHLRLEHAARQIEETTKPLAKIAADLGFADQAHLSRVFKQHKGLSPSAYRGSTSFKQALRKAARNTLSATS